MFYSQLLLPIGQARVWLPVASRPKELLQSTKLLLQTPTLFNLLEQKVGASYELSFMLPQIASIGNHYKGDTLSGALHG